MGDHLRGRGIFRAGGVVGQEPARPGSGGPFRLVAGLCLALALAACGSTPVPTYNLSAPSGFTAGGSGTGQLVVMAPTALAVLNTDKVMVEPGPGQVAYLADAQWSDSLPALLQARAIQAFENGSKLRRVARPGDGVTADYQLVMDIRTFALRITDQGPVAVVELSAKLIGAQSGRILAAQVFRAAVPAASSAGQAATFALNDAADQVLVAMVRWASGRF
ncbi:ABC-type transport auxiliary lipoprotein family protein [Xanthobacter autotrophicus DSM 431]|uniref:ABC-type transport auxiliary lipoprotein family protein n=1 Tax=Xanthobacter nonsaccharivorans TaxID=3119912 RepID=UPI00372955FD